MNLQPLVSIIIPTYNREVLLKDAILSVLGQTYKNFELIIVDDCSKYDIKKIADSFKDNRIKYFRHEKNSGVSASCNTGIKKASGNYVFILNDDDLIVPSALEKFVDKFQESKIENLGGIYSWSWWVNSNGKTLRIIDSKAKGFILKKILRKQIFTNLLIKKEVLEKVGLYNESLRNNEDFDFYLRMAKEYQFDFVPEILVVIRKHDQGHLSSFLPKNITGAGEISKKYSNNFSDKKKYIASIFPPKLYVKMSDLKNYIIYLIKLVFNPKIKEQIILIKRGLEKQGIKI